MTLHDAIEKVLKQEQRSITTQQIATFLNCNKWYKKADGSLITAFQIHRRTKKYSRLFIRSGALVALAGSSVDKLLPKTTNTVKIKCKQNSSYKDELYILDICDKVLGLKSSKQHKFDYLVGDPNEKGSVRKLPVDAYYKELNLVIEYHEKQHTESVSFFDKSNILTVSGVDRGKQRIIYDKRKKDLLMANNVTLIVISYSSFQHNKQKRLIRTPEDEDVVIKYLKHLTFCR
ncbi:hypothetical protein [Mucilaginibacter sp.]